MNISLDKINEMEQIMMDRGFSSYFWAYKNSYAVKLDGEDYKRYQGLLVRLNNLYDEVFRTTSLDQSFKAIDEFGLKHGVEDYADGVIREVSTSGNYNMITRSGNARSVIMQIKPQYLVRLENLYRWYNLEEKEIEKTRIEVEDTQLESSSDISNLIRQKINEAYSNLGNNSISTLKSILDIPYFGNKVLGQAYTLEFASDFDALERVTDDMLSNMGLSTYDYFMIERGNIEGYSADKISAVSSIIGSTSALEEPEEHERQR